MSTKSGRARGKQMNTAILDKIINETSPRSFSSNELDEIMSLSDTSIDTNGKLVQRKMPIWPIGSSDKNKNNTYDDDVNVKSQTKQNQSKSEEDIAKEAVAAAAAAADALGKDLEAMGYDLECRSFIKKHGEDSFTAQSSENDNVERYTSTNTIAPFSEEEVNNNNNDVLKLLRSTSDLIEATRSSSDLIVALRSLSSDEQQDAVCPIATMGSNGTGPMMVLTPPENDERSMASNKKRDTNSISSRKSNRAIQSQPSNKSFRSQKSLISCRSQKNNTATSSIKSQKTSSSRRTSKIHIDRLPKQELDQRKSSEPVIVETVTSIPSTLSQYHVQYTTTSSGDDDEPLKLMASPSQQKTMISHQSPTVIHEETVIVSDGANTEEEIPIEVTDVESTKIAKTDRKIPKTKGTSRNLETQSYHVPSTLRTQQPPKLQESRDLSSPERIPKILRSTSEGGKPNTGGTNPAKFHRSSQRHVRNSGIIKDGTVKSKSSYWSAKGTSKKSWKSRITNKSQSPQDQEDDDDEVSEVSSMASSHAAPPFPILSIPMKNTKKKSIHVDENASNSSKRPPRIPKASSSQRSTTVSVKSNTPNTDVVTEQGYIETKRSIDSRTMDEMSPEGMEMTAIVKNDKDHDDELCGKTVPVDVDLAAVPSMESRSSSKKILKAFSKGSRVSLTKQNNLPIEYPDQTILLEECEKPSEVERAQIESPRKEDTFGITSNLSTEESNEQKAKKQEQIARQLILANMVERQRRIRRSLHTRDTLLKLVNQKTGDDRFDSMTLPPTFETTNPSMRSTAKSAPAHVEYAPPIVPATTTSMTTMPRQAMSINLNDNFIASPATSEMGDESVVSDSTPKVRGGARIFNFLSFSPEKRPRVAKVSKSQQPPLSKVKLIQIPSFGRRSKNVQSDGEQQKKKSKKTIHHRSLFHLKKSDTSKPRANMFSSKKKEDVAPILSEPSEEMPSSNEIEVSTSDMPIIKKNPKVTTYVDLDESFEAIEVAFSKSPDSFSSTLPPMLGADTVLEKIMEEGSCDDVKSFPSSSPDDAPVYDVQPLMISPVHAASNPANGDMLTLTRKAALEDLKKVGASMIASKIDVLPRNNSDNAIKESVESQPKQTTVSFFSAVDKWFFEPMSRSSAIKKYETSNKNIAAATKPTELTDKVFSGLALSVANDVKPTAIGIGTMSTNMLAEKQSVLSPINKDREKTLEYLDQELKSREENSLKSISELEERILDGSIDYNRTVPTHLILNNANDDDGSCLTALNSTLTRTMPHSTQDRFSHGKDDVSTLSDVLTMDQWNEIAEAAYTVERALKNIEHSGGLKSTKSDTNNSKPSFAFINDEVEDALHILSKHAARLGVSESDILMALGGSSYDDETEVETLDPSILAQQLSRSPGPRAKARHVNQLATTDEDDMETAVTMDDGTTNSLTIGEEILEVLQMYMAKK